jgi:hypothetical protein
VKVGVDLDVLHAHDREPREGKKCRAHAHLVGGDGARYLAAVLQPVAHHLERIDRLLRPQHAAGDHDADRVVMVHQVARVRGQEGHLVCSLQLGRGPVGVWLYRGCVDLFCVFIAGHMVRSMMGGCWSWWTRWHLPGANVIAGGVIDDVGVLNVSGLNIGDLADLDRLTDLSSTFLSDGDSSSQEAYPRSRQGHR